jgi:DNA (cytosine-5)-methyltransferase 1
MLNVATLFSGVGTPEQSLKHLNIDHETVFACEIDKYARKTYLANNQAPNTFYEDVYNIDGNKYKNQIDILIGGSPCQSFSIAGKRKGINDARGNLIYEYFRIVEETQPKVFIYENVKGFLSIDKKNKKDKYGETFTNFLESFKELGYTTYHQVLNTKDYGVPQNRERIYIVGFKDEVDFYFQEKQELKLRLKDMLEGEVDKKYLLSQELISKYLETGTASNHKGSRAGKVADETDETFWTVNAGTHGYSMGYVKLKQTHTLNIKGNDSIKRIYSSEGLCPSLTTMQGGHREPKVSILNGLIEVSDEVRVKEATKLGYKVAEEGDSINISVPSSKSRRGRVGKQVAQTLDTACSQVVFNNQYIFRKLTPRECFRLQGFCSYKEKKEYFSPFEKKYEIEDSFIFPPKMSDTQLYKQAGNGMSRNILDMIFTQIFTCYASYIEKKN